MLGFTPSPTTMSTCGCDSLHSSTVRETGPRDRTAHLCESYRPGPEGGRFLSYIRANPHARGRKIFRTTHSPPGKPGEWVSVPSILADMPRQPRPGDIVCPRCGWPSNAPNDIREGYCGHCHMFHDDMARLDLLDREDSSPSPSSP